MRSRISGWESGSKSARNPSTNDSDGKIVLPMAAMPPVKLSTRAANRPTPRTVWKTIDTEVHPPKILLLRGRAELDVVDGIPDEYLQASGTYKMTPEQRVEWEAEVRSLYHEGMVRIVVTPNWAKLIDFETTLPTPVEQLIHQRAVDRIIADGPRRVHVRRERQPRQVRETTSKYCAPPLSMMAAR